MKSRVLVSFLMCFALFAAHQDVGAGVGASGPIDEEGEREGVGSSRAQETGAPQYSPLEVGVEVVTDADGKTSMQLYENFPCRLVGPGHPPRRPGERDPVYHRGSQQVMKMFPDKTFWQLPESPEVLQEMGKSLIFYKGDPLRTVTISQVSTFSDLQNVLEALCWKAPEEGQSHCTNPRLSTLIIKAYTLSEADQRAAVTECVKRFPGLVDFSFTPLPEDVILNLGVTFPCLKKFSCGLKKYRVRRPNQADGLGGESSGVGRPSA